MPIEEITLAQKQARMFFEDLSRKLNPKNKLYKLRSLINWSELEENVSQLVNVSELGRTRKSRLNHFNLAVYGL